MQADAEFIRQYGSHDDNNCFLGEVYLIKECSDKYDEIRNKMTQNDGDIDHLQFVESRCLDEREKI